MGSTGVESTSLVPVSFVHHLLHSANLILTLPILCTILTIIYIIYQFLNTLTGSYYLMFAIMILCTGSCMALYPDKLARVLAVPSTILILVTCTNRQPHRAETETEREGRHDLMCPCLCVCMCICVGFLSLSPLSLWFALFPSPLCHNRYPLLLRSECPIRLLR